MSYIHDMIKTHPTIKDESMCSALEKCIQVCFDCAQACTTCSDACLGEKSVESLRATIRATADCSDICISTGKMLSRLNDPDWVLIKAQIAACVNAVRHCGMMCNEHRHHHEHCAVCANACRECENACSDYLKSIG
jgi:hypothetical protein